jgi:hypothetical protein
MVTMKLMILSIPVAVVLCSCSRSNNLLLGEVEARVGTHTVRVTDCYRTSVPPPERLPDVNGQPAYVFMPCRDANIRIQAGELTVNGQSYGRIGETDVVLVDHAKVSVNPAESRVRTNR